MNYLCVDIGTTCSKGQVFDEKGNILFYESEECPLININGNNYADILAIKKSVFSIIKNATGKIKDIDSIAFSTFGESFVLLDQNDNILTYPFLYTDARGEKQASDIGKIISKEDIYRLVGVMPHPMYSLYKLMYIKENMQKDFYKADKLLLICDYFGYLLTGKRVIDFALASRTGVFDICKKEFSAEILNKVDIDINLFSTPKEVGTIVGYIKEDVRKELGLSKDCKLVLGSHDQVCATIGAGVIDNGQSADGMGTVECITTVFDKIPCDVNAGYNGYPIVPFINGLYCTYILNLTSNSIMNWFRNDILKNFTEDNKSQFSYLEDRANRLTDVIVLPYFAASSTPYQDVNAKGSIINLTLNTTDGDIYRAIMESTSYEMKLNFEVVKDYGITVNSVVATGGGANSKLWLQIKSDIFNIPIKTLRSSEGGLCGLAILSSVAVGQFDNLQQATEVFVKYKDEFLPTHLNDDIYNDKFCKYKKMYKALKEFF